ncbi:MAG: sulfate ABC transporter permease subunit CysW [Kiritimatiellia bacterium]|nr:sulfate ABC transporter permease subunit CysW [Kiritimatiellia bacterium]
MSWGNLALSVTAVAIVGTVIVLPLLVVLKEAFAAGLGVWAASVTDPDARSAVALTLGVTAAVVPLNTLFGVAAAWTIAKFCFTGRSLLLSLVDLPFAVSPVVAGLIFILLFGRHGWLGGWLDARDLQVVFAVPGVLLATLFVTFPFVARELIPLMTEQGAEEEEAALSLGANGWQTFAKVTLPNIKWGLLYGIILCNARAMGEFGAVSVVSGHIRGETNTLPLHVEVLYNEYRFTAAFACASLLAGLAMVTLIVKAVVERQAARQSARGGEV